MYAVASFNVPALFSARMLSTNAFAARTTVCPAPATVKLALLTALLRRDGPSAGQIHLDWLAPLDVAWKPPQRLAVSAVTVRVWKGEQINQALTMSVGYREYVSIDGPFSLAIGPVPDAHQPDADFSLSQLRALGNAESLVQPLRPPTWAQEIPDGFISLTGAPLDSGPFPIVLDDLGPSPSFERLSAFRRPGKDNVPRLGVDRVRTIVRLPLRIIRRSVNSYVLERTP